MCSEGGLRGNTGSCVVFLAVHSRRHCRGRSCHPAPSPLSRPSFLPAPLPPCPNPQVLYSKFGFMYTDIKLGEEEFILIREDDIIGEGGGTGMWGVTVMRGGGCRLHLRAAGSCLGPALLLSLTLCCCRLQPETTCAPV